MSLPGPQLRSNRPGSDIISPARVLADLVDFRWNRRRTRVTSSRAHDRVPVLTNEYWTSRQRAANSLHEISYRACFKPQLPAFFIDRLTRPGDTVYDPFAGRGTTLLEAALRGRTPAGCDINPLAQALLWPRLKPPLLSDVRRRLDRLEIARPGEAPSALLAFYHPETLTEIASLRTYLLERAARGERRRGAVRRARGDGRRAEPGRRAGAAGLHGPPERLRRPLDDRFRIDVCAGMGATESGARSRDGAYPPIPVVGDRRARRRVATTNRVCGYSKSII